MDDVYDLWGKHLKVGDFITPLDGSDYIGKILYISKDNDTVHHQCLKTGRIWEKSYVGFGIRYRKYESVLKCKDR